MRPRKGPQGLHYFNRDGGLNVLIDEASVPLDEWSEAPRTLSVALSNACDCSCRGCFAPKNKAALELDSVAEWSVELDQAGGHSVGFGGGEPTLVDGLAGLCRRITSSTALAVTLTTHGLNLTHRLADALSGSVHFVRISIAGIHGDYEAVHGRPFSELIRRLPAIRSIAPIGFNCLVNAQTIDSLDRTAEFAMGQGATELLLLPQVSPSGEVMLTRSEADTLAAWIHTHQDNYPLALSAHAVETVPVEALPVGDPRGATYDFMHIDAAGTLRPSAFSRQGVPIDQAGLTAAARRLRYAMTAASLEHS